MYDETKEVTYIIKPDLDPKVQQLNKRRDILKAFGGKTKSTVESMFAENGKEHHIFGPDVVSDVRTEAMNQLDRYDPIMVQFADYVHEVWGGPDSFIREID